jgi:hypothetical protein
VCNVDDGEPLTLRMVRNICPLINLFVFIIFGCFNIIGIYYLPLGWILIAIIHVLVFMYIMALIQMCKMYYRNRIIIE